MSTESGQMVSGAFTGLRQYPEKTVAFEVLSQASENLQT